MYSRRHLCGGYSALLVLALFSVTFHGTRTQQLHSCGDIHNITFPFQLKGGGGDNDGATCKDANYTLVCDNNRTVLSLFSGKYYVQAINYNNSTIRLVDVNIQSNNVCSVPLRTLSNINFTYGDPYALEMASYVVFLNCENPVNSPRYINRSSSSANCNNSGSVDGYSYVLVGEMRVWDVADSCGVEKIALSSSPLLFDGASNNYSVLDVNEGLSYGFEVGWGLTTCRECRDRASCFGNSLNAAAIWFNACSSNYKPSFLSKLWRDLTDSIFLEIIIIGSILCARFLCAPCAFGFLIYKFRRRHLSMFDDIEGFLRSRNNLLPIRYSYSDIKKMTNNFRDKLGEGGYGCVYKGKLRSGNFVAVKMLSKSKANWQEFINEVGTIGRIHHVNVVQLIGYCAESSKRALVYDFMPNGSLEKYIFSREGSFSLSCKQIYEISLGVAHGIEYLHRGCDMQILHFDIKPHNILLNENFTPKVSDFGLAKLYPTDDSIVYLTAARGTMGYMAPELFYKNIGGVSYKADVYSFGMLLMEMAGRRRNWNSSADSSQIFFPSWVYDQFTSGNHIEIGETVAEEERELVEKMMLVALWCIQMNPSDRPSMSKVVEMLEGKFEFIRIPPKPFLYPQDHGNDKNSLSGACMDSITTGVTAR